MKYMASRIFNLLLAIGLIVGCATQPDTEREEINYTKATSFAVNLPSPQLPTWAKQASIYEVNIRQYTPDGTLNAFAKHLPRLKEMGVDILWLMPIFPISNVKRKGPLGSYYAVSDFTSVNPEFGTKEDFEALVKQIHDLGMYVILDWVPNHTGWDHTWITSHPEWYVHDTKTDTIIHARDNDNKITDWYDVAELNYDNPDMREAMIDDLRFWVKEMGVDGYRFDIAAGAPLDFWKECTDQLKRIKPVFLLAESDLPAHRNTGCFHMNYGWEFHHLMNDIAKGKKNALDISLYFRKNLVANKKGFPMMFTSNHDENSWNGTVFERMGDGHKAFAILAATIDGMPLIYSGQEEPLKKRLAFFEKDTINFSDYAYHDFYQRILKLKETNSALANGSDGGNLIILPTGRDESVIAYIRESSDSKVLVIINLSAFPQKVSLTDERVIGQYNNIFANSTMNVPREFSMNLSPWDYLVLEQ